MYYWSSAIYGRKGYRDFQFFVQLSESDIDTITAEFWYTTGADGRDGIYANIDRLYNNEALIRACEITSSEFIPEEIFITKDNGRTVITFEE